MNERLKYAQTLNNSLNIELEAFDLFDSINNLFRGDLQSKWNYEIMKF